MLHFVSKHLLHCVELIKVVPELRETEVKYEDIFGSLNDQLAAVKLFTKVIKQRKILMETNPTS